MADELEEVIREKAGGSADAVDDAGSVDYRKRTHQIVADNYLVSMKAAKVTRPGPGVQQLRHRPV